MIARFAIKSVPPDHRKVCGQGAVLVVTYVAYAIVTAARLPYAISKDQLVKWEPFVGSHGKIHLGLLDTIFMAGYASCMPLMGAIADRTNQSRFLAFGLCVVGIMLVLVGLAHQWNVHSYAYFASHTFLGGCAQSIAYPCVIAIITRWCGNANIGFILGIWSTCTPVGTIAGKFGSLAFINSGWQAVFISAGIVTSASAIVVWLFLVPDPLEVQVLRPEPGTGGISPSASTSLLEQRRNGTAMFPRSNNTVVSAERAVSIRQVILVPGLICFSLACFCSKLVYYAFVFWLPFYLKEVFQYSSGQADELSMFFDIGGIVGGLIGGFLMDKLRIRAPLLFTFQIFSTPMLVLFAFLGNVGNINRVFIAIFLFFLGVTVTTPYSLITSVMAAHLGRDPSLDGNSKAAATATAILDGTGSFGAVVQGLMVGSMNQKTKNWSATFGALALFSVFSSSCLLRPAHKELHDRRTVVAPTSGAQATAT